MKQGSRLEKSSSSSFCDNALFIALRNRTWRKDLWMHRLEIKGVFIVMALCFNVLRCFVVLSGVQDKRNGRGEEESKDVAGLQNVFVC